MILLAVAAALACAGGTPARLIIAAVVYTPFLQDVFGTASLGLDRLAVIAPFPVVVWAR